MKISNLNTKKMKFRFEAPRGTVCYTPSGDAKFVDGTFSTDSPEVAKYVRNGRLVKEVSEKTPSKLTEKAVVLEKPIEDTVECEECKIDPKDDSCVDLVESNVDEKPKNTKKRSKKSKKSSK